MFPEISGGQNRNRKKARANERFVKYILRAYCGFTNEDDFLDCEIDEAIYFVVQHDADVMEERAFYYALAGGKAKDDPYFKEFYRPEEINMENEKLDDDELAQLKHAHEFLTRRTNG